MVASVSEKKPYRRIATEEAWISPELLALYQKMLKEGQMILASSACGGIMGSE